MLPPPLALDSPSDVRVDGRGWGRGGGGARERGRYVDVDDVEHRELGAVELRQSELRQSMRGESEWLFPPQLPPQLPSQFPPEFPPRDSELTRRPPLRSSGSAAATILHSVPEARAVRQKSLWPNPRPRMGARNGDGGIGDANIGREGARWQRGTTLPLPPAPQRRDVGSSAAESRESEQLGTPGLDALVRRAEDRLRELQLMEQASPAGASIEQAPPASNGAAGGGAHVVAGRGDEALRASRWGDTPPPTPHIPSYPTFNPPLLSISTPPLPPQYHPTATPIPPPHAPPIPLPPHHPQVASRFRRTQRCAR